MDEEKTGFELKENLLPPSFVRKKFKEICDEKKVDLPKITVYEANKSDLSQRMYTITIEESRSKNFTCYHIIEIIESDGKITNIQEYHSK